jgi:acetyl-CoA acetyltransferase
MRFTRAVIPLGFAWSSPFARWQGPLSELSSIDLAVDVTGRALAERGLDVAEPTHWILGTTVPQATSFYGVTTITRRLGAAAATGPTISQACATSAACLEAAATQVELGGHGTVLALLSDRTSNGPTLLWPSPSRPGGAPTTEHWVLDPMLSDPTTGRRAEPAAMPKAPVPAALNALAAAGLDLATVEIVTTHNPFAVNDPWFSQQTGFPPERMNPYGCSLVYGHPQGPTGARAIAELIVALEERGGGRGLFTGCAAGDTAGAVVVEVTDR